MAILKGSATESKPAVFVLTAFEPGAAFKKMLRAQRNLPLARVRVPRSEVCQDLKPRFCWDEIARVLPAITAVPVSSKHILIQAPAAGVMPSDPRGDEFIHLIWATPMFWRKAQGLVGAGGTQNLFQMQLGLARSLSSVFNHNVAALHRSTSNMFYVFL
ncbi:hypothetical protein IRJ41_011088 [Triplophysa rosa]|uniref:Uncharacterized protein n=1 Tax=Triplophysa rosa TaxID=992332 RepID=A0A9W7WUR4_TRIRA|nr:hypothetical protein IRJ41_011088 [Triplophysa rosa]